MIADIFPGSLSRITVSFRPSKEGGSPTTVHHGGSGRRPSARRLRQELIEQIISTHWVEGRIPVDSSMGSARVRPGGRSVSCIFLCPCRNAGSDRGQIMTAQARVFPEGARGRPLGVGSLPHTDEEVALDFVERHFREIPFWPQLPRRRPADGMIRQFLGPGFDYFETRRRHGGREMGYDIRADAARGLEEWLQHGDAQDVALPGVEALTQRLVAGSLRRRRTGQGVRSQAPSPSARCSFDADVPFASEQRWLTAVMRHLERVGRHQIDRLGQHGLPVLPDDRRTLGRTTRKR